MIKKTHGNYIFIFLTTFLAPALSKAASKEEMLKLNAAYPLGSTVVCSNFHPGNGKELLSTVTISRGKVISTDTNKTTYDVTIKTTPKEMKSPTFILRYKMISSLADGGEVSWIEPSSVNAEIPGKPYLDQKVTMDVRKKFSGHKEFQPYTKTTITEFPSYKFQNPGETPYYCHKE